MVFFSFTLLVDDFGGFWHFRALFQDLMKLRTMRGGVAHEVVDKLKWWCRKGFVDATCAKLLHGQGYQTLTNYSN